MEVAAGGRTRDLPRALFPWANTCQNDLVLKVTQTDVPYFNAPIFLENKQQVTDKI